MFFQELNTRRQQPSQAADCDETYSWGNAHLSGIGSEELSLPWYNGMIAPLWPKGRVHKNNLSKYRGKPCMHWKMH